MSILTQSSLAPFVLSALFFILLKAGYYLQGQALCRHPLTAGIVLWLLTGNADLLLAAVFFELFWLDFFYVGTFVPPDSLFAYMLFAPIMLNLGLHLPQDICMPLLMCLPFAAIGGKLENRLRASQSRSHEAVNQAIDERADIIKVTTSVVRKNILRLVTVDIIFYALSAMLVYGALWLWIWRFGGIYMVNWANWGFLLCLAALGGFLSLRIHWARVCFLACVLVVGGIIIF